MGRPRKLADKLDGHLSIADKEEREATEKNMEDLVDIDLTPPDWLDTVAKEEYERIVPLLKELPIKALDHGMVVAYCIAYSDLVRSTEELKNGPDVIETAHGTKINQYHTIRRNAIDKINSITPKLGMTVDARLKIFVPKPEEKSDPFKELMEDG